MTIFQSLILCISFASLVVAILSFHQKITTLRKNKGDNQMELDFIWLALGIAAAGYFIGNGLKNFRNPDAKDSLSEFFNEDDDHELIKEKDVHYFLGISKEDARALIHDHPDIPHLLINDNVYYPKAKLRKWLTDL